jgi:hypothetical protein
MVWTVHRVRTASAVLLFCVGLGASGTGCSRDPEIEERPVVVYSPRACPVAQSEAFSVLYAGGDFEPSAAQPPTASVFLREVGRSMAALPRQTRSLVVDVSQGPIGWRGTTDIADQGPINVLVWPGGESCRLTRDVERRSDMTFGVFGRHFMVAGGRALAGSQVPHTYIGDLSTGAIERLAFGLNTRRSSPSITEFRIAGERDGGPSAALVAGGHDPDSGIDGIPHRAIGSAEIYVPKASGTVGDFEGQRIDLSEPRTLHGAVVLATGETLLVGGRGPAGPLRSMEIVDPVTRRARTAGVGLLKVARERPTVLRLANGEILIAGGFDAGKNAVPTLEWFNPDGSEPVRKVAVDLVTGRERAYVALDGGGALAVIRPPEDAPPDFKTVWMISADKTLEPAIAVDPAMLDSVRLFPGAGGAPVLWTGKRWLRWAPWLGGFETVVDAPDPARGSAGPTLDLIANGDPGLALWLDDRGDAGLNVTGWRFATRTRFDAVRKPLLASGPDQLAPDRLAGIPGSSIRFDPTAGLLLGEGTSAFVTDVTFADVDIALEVAPPVAAIVLRPEYGDELEVGGGSCAFAQTAQRSLFVKRRDRRVVVSVDGAPDRVCPFFLEPGARVAVGVRGTQGVSRAKNLLITRR